MNETTNRPKWYDKPMRNRKPSAMERHRAELIASQVRYEANQTSAHLAAIAGYEENAR
jgi:hypothetical protein